MERGTPTDNFHTEIAYNIYQAFEKIHYTVTYFELTVRDDFATVFESEAHSFHRRISRKKLSQPHALHAVFAADF
jgi:hypothetical protein